MMNNVVASKKYSSGVTFYGGSVSHAVRQFSETCESVNFFLFEFHVWREWKFGMV